MGKELKLHQFKSANSKAKSTYKIIEGLAEVKDKISHVKTVDEWNAVRETLKSEFPMEVISALDASRFSITLNLQV